MIAARCTWVVWDARPGCRHKSVNGYIPDLDLEFRVRQG